MIKGLEPPYSDKFLRKQSMDRLERANLFYLEATRNHNNQLAEFRGSQTSVLGKPLPTRQYFLFTKDISDWSRNSE